MADVAAPSHESTPQVLHPETHKHDDQRDMLVHIDHKDLCMEMAGSFVGPVFVKEFVQKFMNIPGRRRKIPRADFSNVLRGTSNADMYDSLISAIKKSKICPRMVFKKLSDITQEDSALRPDLAGFNATNGEPSDNANIWSSMQLCIDNCAEDAFDVAYDPNDREGLRVSEEGNTKFLGRMIHYAREQMSHQHRVFMFSLHIVHDSARIIRWDRMGAIVTEAFNFVLHPQILAEFLFRFSLLGPEGRGLDSSAELAGSEECHEFAEAVANYLDSFGERKPPHFDATLDASYPTYKIHIVESGSGVRSSFIVRRPFFETPLPCGRATQGYIAWDIGQRKLVFLKDTWRPAESNSLSEKEVYELLGKHKVLYVPTVLIAEDVVSSTGVPQRTVTQDYSEISFGSRCAQLRPHVHHRIVQELALPLMMMRRSKQLVQAIRNTLVAIRGAYRDAQTLHRDISMANIMLDSNMNGFLNDWDRAIRLSASEADRATRTGTWRFLSIEQLGSKNKIHEIHDDLESCFWVFLYAALHHFRHLPAPFDMSIFEDVRDRKRSDGTTHTVGGIAKAAALVIGAVRNLSFDCRPLTEAIHHVSLIFEDLYTSRVGSGFRGDIAMEFQAAHAKIRADTEDPSPLIKFLDAVLDRDDWPQEDDALVDLYPPLKASYPLDEDENSYSAQDSPYIDHNHPPSPAAISDNVRGVCGTQPVVVEDQLGYIKRGAVRSRSHPASSEVNTNTEHPPPPALTSGETVGSDPRACELLIRIGKQPAPESVSYGADEPKVKRPRMAKRRGPKQRNTTRTHAMTLRPRAKASHSTPAVTKMNIVAQVTPHKPTAVQTYNLWLVCATQGFQQYKASNSRSTTTSFLMPLNPPLESEPFKVTAQGLHHYGCTILRAPEMRKQLCTEMGGSFAGGMPPKDFLKIFMRGDTKKRLSPIPSVDFSEVAAAPSEPKMYGPLINAINTHRLCQGVTFKDISGRAQSGTKLKPDIGGFEGNEMQLYIELKPSERQDAFHDSHNPDDRIEKQTDESSKHRGQIIHYAAEQMAVQHRVSLLTISMTGRIARFIRWDRSGAIVTKAFDYVDSPHLLAEFLIRFSRLNAAQRGFDTTVTPADQHEIASLSSALERYADLFGKRLPTQLEEDQAGQQRAYKIPAIIGNGTRTALVVGKPFCQPLSPCGRATRGYIAWDIVQGKLVFLKDTWRVVSPGSLSESEAYEHLKGHGVPHLPTIIAAADVTDLTGNPQQTLTQDFANHPWCRPHDSLRLLVHHRVIQKLALPLSMVQNSKQLVQAIRNALVTIRCAHKAGNMLHRDVSVSNIMLDLGMKGILNDWDHNMMLPAHPDHIPHPYRTGHWQFASVSLLGDPHKPHEVHDDIESCVWVLLYFSLHFISHQSQHFSMTLFDQWEERACHCGLVHAFGGSMKMHAVMAKEFGEVKFKCGPLDHLIRELTKTLLPRFLFRRDTAETYGQDEVQSYIQLFDEALSRDDWLVEDAVEDQLPPKSALQTSQAHEKTRSLSFSTSRCFQEQDARTSRSLCSTIAEMGVRSDNLPPRAAMTACNVSAITPGIHPPLKHGGLLARPMGPPPLPEILDEHPVKFHTSSSSIVTTGGQLAFPDGVTKEEGRSRNLKRRRDEDEIEELRFSVPVKHRRTVWLHTRPRYSAMRSARKSDSHR